VAKRRGRDRYEVFDGALRHDLHQDLRVRNELHEALETNAFDIFYQPVVSLATGDVVSVEALLRWNHPRRGLLSAGRFIGDAEREGLTVPLGSWVLRQVCQQLAQWTDWFGDNTPTISVNVSARQLSHPDSVGEVASILEALTVDPSRISIELTESTLMDDTEQTLHRLDAFRTLGVTLAIDDFGTGFSSLSYLKRLPVDILKIDKVFIDDLETDSRDAAIVAAVVSLAEALDLSVVAEGIETAAQLTRVRELGCDLAQGYHLGRPQPAAEISSLLSMRL
jgi:EAL domain-containing protein (putative c-di-GMP-specific phosphodiesterase class I)